MNFRRALKLAMFICALPCSAQTPDIKFTPPGKVLVSACEQLNAEGSSAKAIFDRAYCFRYIQAVLEMDRFQIMEQNERQKKWDEGKGPFTALPVHFCYPHGDLKQWGVNGGAISGVAKDLVTYLRALPDANLDRLSDADDTQMRLLMGFLRKRYPC